VKQHVAPTKRSLRDIDKQAVADTFARYQSEHTHAVNSLIKTATALHVFGDPAPLNQLQCQADAVTEAFCKALVQRYAPHVIQALKEEYQAKLPELNKQIALIEDNAHTTFRGLLLITTSDETKQILLRQTNEQSTIDDVAKCWELFGADYLDAVRAEYNAAKKSEKQQQQLSHFYSKASPVITKIIEHVLTEQRALSSEELTHITDRAPISWHAHMPSDAVLEAITGDPKLIDAMKVSLKKAKQERDALIYAVGCAFRVTSESLQKLSSLPSNSELIKRLELIHTAALTPDELAKSGVSGQELLFKAPLDELPALFAACKKLATTKHHFVCPLYLSAQTQVPASIDAIKVMDEKIVQAHAHPLALPPAFVKACNTWLKDRLTQLSTPYTRRGDLSITDTRKALDVIMFGFFRLNSFNYTYQAEELYNYLHERNIFQESQESFLKLLNQLRQSQIIAVSESVLSKSSYVQLAPNSDPWGDTLNLWHLNQKLESLAPHDQAAAKICTLTHLSQIVVHIRKITTAYQEFFIPISEGIDLSVLEARTSSTDAELGLSMQFFTSHKSSIRFGYGVSKEVAELFHLLEKNHTIKNPSWLSQEYQPLIDGCEKILDELLTIPAFSSLGSRSFLTLKGSPTDIFKQYAAKTIDVLQPHEDTLYQISADSINLAEQIETERRLLA
jgi:hypothetical protein